jgi:hypothetical protein
MSATGILVPPNLNATDFFDELPVDFSLDDLPIELDVLVAIVLLTIGTIFLFFGTRLFKYTLFFCCAVIGACLGYYAVVLISENTKVALIVGGVMGLMLGALATKLWKLAIFLLGAACGFVLWLTFKALFPDVLDSEALLYGTLVGLCLVLGLIGLKLEKVWLLIGTPILGSFMFLQGLNVFIPEEDLNVFQILHYAKSGCLSDACYTLYGLVLGVAALGFLVQWRCTSEWASERRKEARYEEKGRKKGERKARRRRRRSYSD